MKRISFTAMLIFATVLCIGQNNWFDRFEKKMNQLYGYKGPSVQEATQGAFEILHKKFGRREKNYQVSFNVNDWSSDVSKFVRVDYDNIPILSQTNLKGENLKVIGFAKSGEFFQFIERKTEWVKIEKPSGWQLRSYGEWYQVKTLNGEYGWIYGKPYGLNYAYASVVENVVTKSVSNNSSTDSCFPIGAIFVVGIIFFGIGAIVVYFSSSATPTTSSYGSDSYSSSSDSSFPSYSSDYDFQETSIQEREQESSERDFSSAGTTSRCEDCQSIDIGGWGFTSKGNGRCKDCRGTGHDRAAEALVQFGTLGIEDGKIDCKTCSGTGQCQTCGGTGLVYH